MASFTPASSVEDMPALHSGEGVRSTPLCTPRIIGLKLSPLLLTHWTGFWCTTEEKGEKPKIIRETWVQVGRGAKALKPEWWSQLTYAHYPQFSLLTQVPLTLFINNFLLSNLLNL